MWIDAQKPAEPPMNDTMSRGLIVCPNPQERGIITDPTA
jgi:hypothetical protein